MRGVEAVRLFHQRAPSVPLVAILRIRIFQPRDVGADDENYKT